MTPRGFPTYPPLSTSGTSRKIFYLTQMDGMWTPGVILSEGAPVIAFAEDNEVSLLEGLAPAYRREQQ